MLRPTKGNMYDFVTHTWNPIKGKCYHDCSYCYMKRWGEQKPMRLDEREMKTDLGEGNFIFVGSSCDMFAKDVPYAWIERILEKCSQTRNQFLFQSKNPVEFLIFQNQFPQRSIFCTTLETNFIGAEMPCDGLENNAPCNQARAEAISKIAKNGFRTMVTVEPIMDFSLDDFVSMIRDCMPEQVNIGADSGNNNLPEPSAEKTRALIAGLEESGIKVVQKKNLGRLINERT